MEPFIWLKGRIIRSFNNGLGGGRLARIEKDEFAELIRENKIPMYRLAYGIMRNQAEAEDIVGEAIAKAYEHLGSLKDSKKFKPWIMKIVANEAKRQFAKRKRIDLIEDVDTYDFHNNYDDYNSHDNHTELWDVVSSLDEKHRFVIILYYYEEFNVREIAQILHISEGTVKSRLSRARNKLKEMI